MASNGSLMTVPDFPRPAARAQGPRRPDGRLRPAPHRDRQGRRPSTTSSGPAPTPFVLLAMLHVVARRRGSTRLAGVRRRARRRARRPSRRSPPSSPSGTAACPPTMIRAAGARARRRPSRAAVYGRIGVSTQAFGTVCAWAINCLNLLTGHLDRVGGAMFTDPAIDVVGTRADRPRALRRAGAAGSAACPRPAASCPSPTLRRGDRDARRRAGPRRCSRWPATRCCRRPTARGSTEALAGLDFMAAVDIYLNETTRHADVILPPTTALERDHYDLVFHAAGGAQHGAVHARRCSPKADDQRHDWEIFREVALRTTARLRGAQAPLRKRGWSRRARLRRVPHAVIVDLLLRTRPVAGCRYAACARRPEGVDLGPLRPGALPGRLQTRTSRIDLAPAAGAGRPRPARRRTLPARTRASCCSSAAATSATATPGCTTPSGSPGASRATSSSCTPTTSPRAASPTARRSR